VGGSRAAAFSLGREDGDSGAEKPTGPIAKDSQSRQEDRDTDQRTRSKQTPSQAVVEQIAKPGSQSLPTQRPDLRAGKGVGIFHGLKHRKKDKKMEERTAQIHDRPVHHRVEKDA